MTNQKKEDNINRILIWSLIALVINYAILFATALGFAEFARLSILVTIATVLSVFGAGMLAPKKSTGSLIAPLYALIINAILAAAVLFSCGFKTCFEPGQMGLGGLIATAFVVYAPASIIVSFIYAIAEAKHEFFSDLVERYKSIFFVLFGIGIFVGITAVFANLPLQFGFGFITALIMVCFITIFSFYFMYKFNIE